MTPVKPKPKRTRTAVLNVRLTPGELSRLKRHASLAGLSYSDLIRWWIKIGMSPARAMKSSPGRRTWAEFQRDMEAVMRQQMRF